MLFICHHIRWTTKETKLQVLSLFASSLKWWQGYCTFFRFWKVLGLLTKNPFPIISLSLNSLFHYLPIFHVCMMFRLNEVEWELKHFAWCPKWMRPKHSYALQDWKQNLLTLDQKANVIAAQEEIEHKVTYRWIWMELPKANNCMASLSSSSFLFLEHSSY